MGKPVGKDMRAREELDSSLSLVDIDRLMVHERIIEDLQETIFRRMKAEAVLAWPVVADSCSSLILDGSHRYAAVRNRLKGRRILVQAVDFLDRGIKLRNWWRIYRRIRVSQFQRLKEKHDWLSARTGASRGGSRFIFQGLLHRWKEKAGLIGEIFRFRDLEQDLADNFGLEPLFVTEDEAKQYLTRSQTLTLVPPTLTKAELIKMAGGITIPPKSTRFIFPFRVIGPKVPLDWLTGKGNNQAFNERLDQLKAQPIRYLGRGLTIDRFYPEEIYSYQDYTIQRESFLKEKDYRAYLARLKETNNIIY